MLVNRFLFDWDNTKDFCDQRRNRYLLLNLLNLLLNLGLAFRLDFCDQLHRRRWRQRNGYDLRLGSGGECVIVQGNLVLAIDVVGKGL